MCRARPSQSGEIVVVASRGKVSPAHRPPQAFGRKCHMSRGGGIGRRQNMGHYDHQAAQVRGRAIWGTGRFWHAEPHPSGCRVEWWPKSTITRACTASLAASGIAMPATRMTARASSSTRSSGSASYRASQAGPTPGFPARHAGCPYPFPAISRRQDHLWPLPADFCAASCRGRRGTGTSPPRRSRRTPGGSAAASAMVGARPAC
jgi:hypothetical protein